MKSGARTPAGSRRAASRWAVALLALLAAGCGPDDGSRTVGPVSDSVYVEVMARLLLMDSLMGSGADRLPEDLSRDSARRELLREHGVTGDELLTFARERGTRPERMEEIWRRIYELSDSLDDLGWSPASADSGGARDDGAP